MTPRRGEVGVFAAVLLPLGTFAVLGVAAAGKGARGWDDALLDLTERYYRSSLGAWLGRALEVGELLAAVILLVALLLLLKRRRRREAIFCALAVGGVVALDVPLKALFHRPGWSPSGLDTGDGYSFPSGYAMASIALIAAITMISKPRWAKRILVVGVPLLVAIGAVLVYSWWHYPSDVVAGWCLAVSWVSALWIAIRPRPGAIP